VGDEHIVSILEMAIGNSVGPVIAVFVVLWITERTRKTMSRTAAQASLDALKAQEAADLAKMQAANATRQMLIEARGNTTKLDNIIESTHETHTIVNNQRTEMMRTIEGLKADLQLLQSRIDGVKK
jgi:hypothetical protein